MKTLITLLIIGFVIVIMVITNPNEQMHREAVKNKFNTLMQKSTVEQLKNSTNNAEMAGGIIGSMIGTSFIDKIIESIVMSDNYVVFSITRFRYQDQSKIIGIGIFGNVFLSKDLDKIC